MTDARTFPLGRPFDALVVGSHLRWDGMWQRPQQVLSRLAARLPVLVVEEPFVGERERDAIVEAEGVAVLRPLRASGAPQRCDARTLAAVRTWLGERRPLVWLYSPMFLELADAFPQAPLAYDCMDELANFAFSSPQIPRREAALLARASIVFAGGRSLFEARRGRARRLELVPSGVDVEHFAQACELHADPLLAGLPHPIAIYAGALDERLDPALLGALAADGFEVVLVGPVVKLAASAIPRDPHVHLCGKLPYARLPSLFAGADVALMPFARNAATERISPTKTPEYLAAGLPVVSTRIADVLRDFGEVLAFAEGPQAFAAAARAALREDPVRRARGLVLARERTWERVTERMWAALRSL
ncbi:MAG: glycosyltransferase [Vulcanimicrobiaceae bacterium]